jgi:hypothetical protein
MSWKFYVRVAKKPACCCTVEEYASGPVSEEVKKKKKNMERMFKYAVCKNSGIFILISAFLYVL